MANENCGCGTNGSSPPGTTFPTVSSPVGTVSSYGGNAMVARGACRPAACPSPPVSEVPEAVPYCASWVDRVTTRAAGYLALFLEGCIYKLKSKCSGFVYFDRETEQVSVQDPKFVSSVPKENNYGFLAKAVPTVHTVCVEGEDACQQEIRMELAAQVIGQRSCGQLMVGVSPLCGDVPVSQSGDLEKQVHLDYLDAPNHEDLGCPAGVRFLVMTPGTRGPSGRQVVCDQWSLMRRFVLRGSDWGTLAAGSPLEASGYVPVLVPVPGGADNDPCFELRMSSQKLAQGLPTTAENCDTVEFRNKGTELEGWKAVPKGLSFHPIEDRPIVFTSTNASSATAIRTLPDYPAEGVACGAIWVQLETVISAGTGTSGSASGISIKTSDYVIGYAGYTGDNQVVSAMAPTTSEDLTMVFTKSGNGVIPVTIRALGYWY